MDGTGTREVEADMELYQLGAILAVILVGLIVVIVLIIRGKRAAAAAEDSPVAQASAPSAAEPVMELPPEPVIARPPPRGITPRRPAVDEDRLAQRISDLGHRNKALPSASFRHEVEERLTSAFDLFEQKRITLDTFKKLVRAERAEAQRRLAAFDGPGGDHGGEDYAEVNAAYEMTEQCLVWANDFSR